MQRTMSKLTLLVDGDVLVYRMGFSCEYTTFTLLSKDGEVVEEVKGKRALKEFHTAWIGEPLTVKENNVVEPVQNALHTVNLTLDNMITTLQASHVRVFLSGSNNFRNSVYPIYKANRLDQKRPVHYEAIRSYLINKWNAEVVNGMEADDAMGINQSNDTVICTIDKDLDTISGAHYNFVKDTYYEVSHKEAANNFYMQMLAGDGTDNICALRGVGIATAKKRLDAYENYAVGATSEYQKYYGEDWEEAWDCNEQLIGIRYEA